jgi:hypothetical protein
MKTTMKSILLSATTVALMLPAMAQTSQSINERKENQQDRIANGVQNGELTAKETQKLEKKESNLNQEERDMRKLDNGHLTTSDKATLNQQQNQLSKDIYKQKHDAQTQNVNPKSEVGQRQRNQQERIAQGVKSGQLNARETARLEGREAHINKEIHNDRAANGGHLTPAEKAKVNRQENRTSHAIYRQKHDAQHR